MNVFHRPPNPNLDLYSGKITYFHLIHIKSLKFFYVESQRESDSLARNSSLQAKISCLHNDYYQDDRSVIKSKPECVVKQ